MNFILSRNVKGTILLIVVLLFIGFFSTSISYADGTGMSGMDISISGGTYSLTGLESKGDTGFSEMIGKYRNLVMFVVSIVILTLVAVFAINIAKLGASSGNPQARSQAITALLWTGASIAIVGGGGTAFAFFYEFF